MSEKLECPACQSVQTEILTCPDCEGRGELVPEDGWEDYGECPNCDGSGEVPEHQCLNCGEVFDG